MLDPLRRQVRLAHRRRMQEEGRSAIRALAVVGNDEDALAVDMHVQVGLGLQPPFGDVPILRQEQTQGGFAQQGRSTDTTTRPSLATSLLCPRGCVHPFFPLVGVLPASYAGRSASGRRFFRAAH